MCTRICMSYKRNASIKKLKFHISKENENMHCHKDVSSSFLYQISFLDAMWCQLDQNSEPQGAFSLTPSNLPKKVKSALSEGKQNLWCQLGWNRSALIMVFLTELFIRCSNSLIQKCVFPKLHIYTCERVSGVVNKDFKKSVKCRWAYEWNEIYSVMFMIFICLNDFQSNWKKKYPKKKKGLIFA